MFIYVEYCSLFCCPITQSFSVLQFLSLDSFKFINNLIQLNLNSIFHLLSNYLCHDCLSYPMEDKFLCALVQSYLMLFESIIQISDTTDEPVDIYLRMSCDALLLPLI